MSTTMSNPVTITRQPKRQRSASRQGRSGTISPSNSFDPAFAPTSHRFSPSVSPELASVSLSSTPPEINHAVCPVQVGRRLETLSNAVAPGPVEILYLPPLLSLLPGHELSAPQPASLKSASVKYTSSALPAITPLSAALHHALHALRPVTRHYAISPYATSFNWRDLELSRLSDDELAKEREWYIVAFRSKRRRGFTEQESKALYSADREAHEEAIQAGGLLCYWFGAPWPLSRTRDDVVDDRGDLAGRNLATCIWQSRAEALLAMRGEKHKLAAQLASQSYESYTLERYLLRKEPGSTRRGSLPNHLMTDRRLGTYDLSTPLVSARTLQRATSTVGSSRLPLRRDAPSEPMTAPRPSTYLRRPSVSENGSAAVPASASRLPTRRPSVSETAPPSIGRSVTGLKRTSSIADLHQDSEASSLKRQLARALREIEELKHQSERHKLEANLVADKAQTQLSESTARIEKLERHRAVLMAKERETLEREQAKVGEIDQGTAILEKDLKTVKHQLSTLQEQHIDLEAAYKDLEHAARQAVHEAKAEKASNRAFRDELEATRQEVETRTQEILEERRRRVAIEAELEQEKLRGKESASTDLIREELHRQVTHLKALEKDNSKLKRKVETYERQHANVEVLKEANRSLETKLKGLDQLRQQLASQALEMETLKRERSEWSAFVRPEDIDTFSSPRKITKNLAATRIENASLRDRLNTHDLEVRRRDHIIGQLEERASELETQVQDAKKTLKIEQDKGRADHQQVGLLKQEVQMLKRHLESYTTEESLNPAGNYDSQKTARISELESLLQAHQQEITRVSEQAEHWRGLVERYGGNTTEIVALEDRERREAEESDSHDRIGKSLEEQLRLNEELRQELDEARNELTLMEQEIDSLAGQVEQLEENQGIRGAYNPATTKVLEFRDSPDRVEHAIRTAALERLRTENDALLRRIETLETSGIRGGANQQDLVPKESLATLQAEIERLKTAVEQKDKMLQRISQAVKEKTETMRIAISKLLGYQLAFLDSGRIRVTSVHAPSKDRSLAFDPWPGGPMPFRLVSAADESVMQNDQVRQSIAFWLDERKSLSGFMASLTMTLYEESTKGGVVYG
ncbi:uncharacterized protein JCM15063_004157 [Sporobolomyces koalae]|uniref:uncharacterized protein n=1 Tax=Sporobolomyces koalae TaxID=500713 RepID=UPI0031722E98